ncbi:3-hydroxyacyl-CoA dehydrogenase [Aromatoleum toluclasticum]|uniref:3-hydroxyacyl-CoA dehydrogenase n=1 Tax=Aromatoleum toluclasticum TaxID=92003 RepID=UPI001D17DCDC|nr:3-hydroxyacyl-CoA dehydrogenase [Aromatoleum toluclasticum]MCC4114934.1 3-hydroxyacyl-CoA dehydrogenase [Aromatoleum toluclasticum]
MTFLAPVCEAERGRALAYVERARCDAAAIPDLPPGLPLRPVARVGIVGSGTMGGGIAMSFANVGIAVTIIDTDVAALNRGLTRVRRNYDASVARGRLDAAGRDARLARIRGAVDVEALRDADLVIEAVFEDMALKRSIFARLDAVARPGAILATNTSGLDIDEIAAATARPADVVGAHFFSPAHVQKLLEVVRGPRTAPDVIATLMDLGRRLGKVSVLSRVYPGFIGNALFRQYVREAHFLVEEGALPHEVDDALVRFGYAMGVFAVHDMAGNDVGWQMRKAEMATRPRDRRWNDLILELCEMGRLGQKSGLGWYRYDDGDRRPRRDPDVERYIVERSAQLGIARRPIGADEIVERCLYGMINEGARLLEQGIALRASDIDAVLVTGYGFPSERGGPMYWADRIGLGRVCDAVRRLYARHGYWWTPARLLERLAAGDGKFGDL